MDIPHAEMAAATLPSANGEPFPQRGCHGDGGTLGPFAKRKADVRVFCAFLCVLWTPSEQLLWNIEYTDSRICQMPFQAFCFS